MEINVRGKSYKIAWEFVLAPFLLLLVLVIVIISNLSAIKSTWIDYSDDFRVTPLPTSVPVATGPSSGPVGDNPAGGEGKKPAGQASGSPETPKTPETSQTPEPQASLKVNINKAGMDELMTLPFIGEVKAKAIIAYREAHGGFKSVDELDNIKGIGPKTLEKLRPFVTV